MDYAEATKSAHQTGRQEYKLLRSTVEAGQEKARQLISQAKSASGVISFGVGLLEKPVAFAASSLSLPWNAYGDPLLSKLDKKMDEFLYAVERHQQQQQLATPKTVPNTAAESSVPPSPLTLPASPNSQPPAVTLSPPAQNLYTSYWSWLHGKFLQSRWYRAVESILLQNSIIASVSARVNSSLFRPAEVFFSDAMELSMQHTNQDEFLLAMKRRVGAAWDERLNKLARAFFNTAQVVRRLVGAGKFVGGALQLGKASIDAQLEGLMEKWDSVLQVTDTQIDKFLPELDSSSSSSSVPSLQVSPSTPASSLATSSSSPSQNACTNNNTNNALAPPSNMTPNSSTSSLSSLSSLRSSSLSAPVSPQLSPAPTTSTTTSSSSSSSSSPSPSPSSTVASSTPALDLQPGHPEEEQEGEEEEDEDDEVEVEEIVESKEGQSKKRRSMVMLVQKFAKRVRQRLPGPTLSLESLRSALNSAAWFTQVDEVLLKNPLMRSLPKSMPAPAEHLYETLVQMFQSGVHLAETFMARTKSTLGGSWDVLLTPFVSMFFETAQKLSTPPSK